MLVLHLWPHLMRKIPLSSNIKEQSHFLPQSSAEQMLQIKGNPLILGFFFGKNPIQGRQCIYRLFQTAYTQNCIYTFFRRKTAYTHRIHIFENDLPESCFPLYSPFSPPQAPPNGIFHRLFQFPFISDASRYDFRTYSPEIPNIHTSKFLPNRIYTKLHIHIFSSQNCIYTFDVYMRICIYIYTLAFK